MIALQDGEVSQVRDSPLINYVFVGTPQTSSLGVFHYDPKNYQLNHYKTLTVIYYYLTMCRLILERLK